MKTKKSILAFGAALLALLCLFTACDLFQPKNPDYFDELRDEVAYANAPFANVSIGIIPGSLSAAPTQVPREKVGFPFTVQATANFGYGFVGWRVLSQEDWNNYQSGADFESILSFGSGDENILAEIDDDILEGYGPTGGAKITILTEEEIVIVPYAMMRPSLSSASYPAMNAFNIPYMNWIEIRFSVPVEENSFGWDSLKNPNGGGIKNISISAVTSYGTSIESKRLEPLFVIDEDEQKENAEIQSGRLLRIRLNSTGDIPLSDFEGMKFTITLESDIGRRGAENIKMMLNQELVYTVTTNINVVNTRLNNLTVTVDGNFHDFTSGLSSAFDFTLLPVFAAKRITVNAVPAMPNDVNVAISGAVTVLETEVDLAKGRNVITITSAQNGGGGQSIYRININNYPVSTPTTVTLTPKSGQLEVKWDEIIGASGYWVYYNTIPDLVSAQRFPNVITETEAVITGAPGSTLFVWVQAVSGIDAQRLDSPTFSVPVSATILSNNSTLRLLSFSPYSFFPSFFFNTEDYELIQEIANDQDELTVRFARVQDDQRVVWRMNNGATSQNITGDEFTATGFSNIGINKNTLYITVTSVDGTATTTYKIDIYKKPAPPAWAATPFTSHSPDGDKGGKVTVNWDADSVSGHTGFQVYCGPYSNSQVGGTTATVNSPTQGYTDVGNLEPNILYYFWVRSFSGDIGPGSRTVYSDWSPVSQSQSTVNRLNSLTLTNTDNDDLSFSRLRLNYTVNTQYDTTNTTTVGFQKVNPAIQQVTIGLNENAPVALDPLAQTLTLTSLRTGRNIIEVTSTSVFGDVLTYTIIVNRRPGIPVLTDSYTSGNGFLSSVNMGAIDGADFYDVYHNTTGANPTETPASYTFNSITNNGSIASGTIGTTGSLPEGRVYVWVRAKAGNVVGAWSERKEYYVGVAFNHDMLRSENGNPRTRYIAPGTYNISSAHNPQVTGNLTLIPIGNVTLLRLGEYTSEILNVPSGATLNLGHSASPPAYVGTLTIDGAGISAQRAAIIVSGTCNIFSRVTIQNNHNSQTTMDSGLGSGGGLNIIAGSATLNGGSIRNNHSSFQGGGVVVRGSGNIRAIFYLESGYITQNTTSGEGSGLFATGLQNAFAEIYWNGGEIINNTGGTNNKNNGIHFANEFVEQNW